MRMSAAVTFVLIAVATGASGQDTLRVRSDGPGQWGPNARLTHEFTIGELDGPTEYEFGSVRLVAADSAGAFYVWDDRQTQIRRYDANGKFERLIGRRGGGPGEYQAVKGMDVTREGLLVLFDPRSQRISYFQPDGKVRREFSLHRGDFFDAERFSIDTAGLLYLRSRLPGPLEGPTARYQFLRHSRDGIVVDSIPAPRDETPVGSSFLIVTSDGYRFNFPARQTIDAPYALGGVVTARADEYRFVISTPGQRALVIQRSHSRIPLGAREHEEWLAIARDMPPHLRAPNVRYDAPKLKPVIRDLFSDHLGRVWVDVYVAAEKRNVKCRRPGNTRPLLTWRERTTYEVFASTGVYLGRIQLPPESRLLDVRANRVYLRTLGPDCEEQVSVYRIQGENLNR